MNSSCSGEIPWLVGTEWGDVTIADVSCFYDGNGNMEVYLTGEGKVESISFTAEFSKEDLDA